MKTLVNKHDFGIFCFLAFYVFIVLFWLSTNSYTHDLFDKVDSACFFMCGKSWMSGMTPYSEFADSKGPLLWLIYGIGYLLSNQSYIGVFWIEYVFYVFTFFICYKIATLFIDKDKSIMAAVLLAFAIFHKKLHYETRAEDFCQVFIAAGLYMAFYQLKFKRSIQNSKILRNSLLLGFCFGALLLIKYNIAVMFSIFMLSVLVCTAMYKTKSIYKSVLYMIAGAIIILAPFFTYFIVRGNLGDMFKEYVFNTYDTLSPPFFDMLRYYVFEELGGLVLFRRSHISVFCLLMILSTLLFSFKYRQYKFMPFIFCLWFLLITVRNSIHQYYYNILPLFALFGIIFIFSFLKFRIAKGYYHLAFGLICAFVLIYPYNRVYKRINFFTNTADRKGYYEMSEIIALVPNPKLLVGYERGLGLCSATTLPACKYWARQNGATPEMIAERDRCIRDKDADFLLYSTLDYCDYYKNSAFTSGYKVCYEWHRKSGEIIYLMSRDELNTDELKFRTPDNSDIFLKRTLRN